MAAQDKSTKSASSSKNGSVVESVRNAGRQYLDTVEKTWGRVADFQEELGKASGTGVLVSLGRTQANVTREVTGAYLRAARKIVG